MSLLEPKQMTVWIDGDVYHALLTAKAKGAGTLKAQINDTSRRGLGVAEVATLEAQERAAYADNPWAGQDQNELETCQTVQLKPPDKRRPVIILTSNCSVDLLNAVTVAPRSTSLRDTPAHVLLDQDDSLPQGCNAPLHNPQTVPKSLVGKRIATLEQI